MSERKLLALAGAMMAIGLVIAALWGWTRAETFARAGLRPEVLTWAIRSLSVAAGALAQVILVTLVTGAFYRRGAIGDATGVFAGLVATIALVSAIALGFAGM